MKGQVAKKKASNNRPAVRKREVCRVVYFDGRGKFTRAPQKAVKVKATPVAKEKRAAVLKRNLEQVDLDGPGGSAVALVEHLGGGRGVKIWIRDPELEKTKREARGNKALQEEIAQYEKNLRRMVASDVLKRNKAQRQEQQRQREALLMEASYRSEKARKAAKTRTAKRQAVSEEQKKQARNQAKALESRLSGLERELAKAKRLKQKTTLRNRKRRLSKALTQLEKVAAGKAYKMPTAAQLR